MYEDQTYENIITRMLGNLSSDIDKREGSVAYDMLAPKAIELALAYQELDNVINFGFANTTYGSFLDMRAGEAGIVRETSIQSTGSITLTGPESTVIPQGTIVYTDNNIQFTTDYQVIITGGAATVTVTAVVGGISGNVSSNAVKHIGITGVTCINNLGFSNGADTESDSDLLKRYLDKLKEPVTSGNEGHYKEWAKEVSGIGDANVIGLWNGNGTVKVIVISTDKHAVTSEKVTEVQTYIDTNRPIGATVTVESATEVQISVSATLELATNYTTAIVQPAIISSITSYLQSAAFNDPDVKYSKIGTLILGVNGVLDYSNLTINGGTSNVILTNSQTPVLGTVTLS